MEHKDLHNFQQELIEDSSFIAWVRTDFTEDNDKWSSFVDKELDRMDEINGAIRFVRNLDFSDQSTINTSALWKRIEGSTKSQKTKATVISLINWKYIAGIAAAACMIGIFMFRPLSNNSDLKTFKTASVDKITEAFPDGSAITLNAGSEATFDFVNWQNNRKVSLKGMAFFKVRKGSKFTVETPNGQVTVLGTSFSVDARNDNFEVICKTGKVAIITKNGEEKILNPGDIASVLNNVLVFRSTPEGTQGLIPWLDGGFIFDNEDFGNVVSEIESQFGVKVEMDKTYYTMKFTGFFKNNDINDALFSITWPLKLKYTIKGKVVYLEKE